MIQEARPSILLITADINLGPAARLDLERLGYRCSIAPGFENLEILVGAQPDLLVVDTSLQGAIAYCQDQRLRQRRIPIIILTPTESVAERALCLEAGADDYLVKPYQSTAFIKRIQFYLQPRKTQENQLQYAELTLDLISRQVRKQETVIDLTMKEYELLHYLMQHPEQVLNRDEIVENVWGYDFRGESNVLEVYIRYLRLKLEAQDSRRLIHTVRGVGYVLRNS
ncbi:MAG: response regulator transcription factor [Cyanobacteria bacterium P01_H01_bin.15]